ncbi:MAG TPA: GDSL-type esterase/lipase family protein [Sulfuriferula sp.]|nr:GDSL-type esterase/lipase family protein [Sulfuriferula sp.]
MRDYLPTGRVVVWLCLLWVILLAGCGARQPALPHLGPDDVVLAFGDSLTYGTGVDAVQSYPAQLGQLIGRKVVAAGVPGEVTAQGVVRLPGELDAVQPKLLLLCLGGNDLLRNVDPVSIAANLRTMVGEARRRGIAVVLIGVPEPRLFGGVPKFYADIAAAAGVPYEGKVLKTVLFDNTKKSDPIHPNAAGYRMIADALAGVLHQTGAI